MGASAVTAPDTGSWMATLKFTAAMHLMPNARTRMTSPRLNFGMVTGVASPMAASGVQVTVF